MKVVNAFEMWVWPPFPASRLLSAHAPNKMVPFKPAGDSWVMSSAVTSPSEDTFWWIFCSEMHPVFLLCIVIPWEVNPYILRLLNLVVSCIKLFCDVKTSGTKYWSRILVTNIHTKKLTDCSIALEFLDVPQRRVKNDCKTIITVWKKHQHQILTHVQNMFM